MLKNKRKPKLIKCLNCGKKFNITEMIENGDVDRIANIVTVYCPYCGESNVLSNK